MSKDNDVIEGRKAGSGSTSTPTIAKDSASSTTIIDQVIGLSCGEIEGFERSDITLDGTSLSSLSSDIKAEWRFGTQDQKAIDGLDSSAKETSVSVELRSTPWVQAISDTSIDAIGLRFSWGPLQTQDTSGNVSGVTIDYMVEIATDGGAYQTVLDTTISDKTSDNYQRYYEFDLPESIKSGWIIRVTRKTPNSDSSLVSDKMYVKAYVEIIKDKYRYPLLSYVRLAYDAQLFSSVAKVSINAKGLIIKVPTNYDPVARTYSGIWDGTFKLAYTNNPAWIYYDICTNSIYGLGDRIKQNMIDKWSLYRISMYCDEMVDDGQGGKEPRFTCNVYIQSDERAFDILNRITGLFRGFSSWTGSTIECAIDAPDDVSQVYTNSNVVDGLFEYAGASVDDIYSIAKVAWDNPQNNFNTEYEIVKNQDRLQEVGYKVIEVDGWGCTSRGQAIRAGKWALTAEDDRITFKVGMDGYLTMPGKIIGIQDELYAGKSLAGRIVNVSADRTKITIDRDITVDQGSKLITNNTSFGTLSKSIKSYSERVIEVDSAYDDGSVVEGLIWMVDSPSLAIQKYRVLTVTSDDPGTFNIEAIWYDAAKYAEIDSNVVAETPIYSVITPTTQNAVQSITLSSYSKVYQGLNIGVLKIEWERPKDAVKYLVEWRKDSGNWQTLPITANLSTEVENIYTGVYQVRVTAISSFDLYSEPTYSAAINVKAKNGAPPDLNSLDLSGQLFSLIANWTFSKGSDDLAFTRLQVSMVNPTSPSYSEANTQTYDVSYPTASKTFNGLQGGLVVYVRAKVVDKLNSESAWSDWKNATVSTSPNIVLDLLENSISESSLTKDLAERINTAEGASKTAQDAKASADAAASSAASASSSADAATRAANDAQTKLNQEIIDRQKAVNDQQTAWQSRADDLQTGISNETKSRQEDSKATNDSIASMKSSYDSSLSAIQKTQSTQSDKLTTLSNTSDSTLSKINDPSTGLNALSSSINSTNSRVQKAEDGLSTKAEASDLKSLQSLVNSNKSSADQTFATKTDLNSAQSTLQTSLQAAANTAQANSEAYTRDYSYSKADTNSAVSGALQTFDASLTIGGRNLVLNSNFYRGDSLGFGINGGTVNVVDDATYGKIAKVSGSNNNGIFFAPSKGWTDNGKYSVSLLIRNLSGKLKFGVESSGTISADWIIQASSDNVWRKYYITFQKFSTLGAVFLYLDGSGSFDLANIKLEIGTKVTDWTPAPEDNDNKVNSVSSALSSFQQAQANVNSATTQRLDSAMSQLSGQQSSISNIQQTYAKTSEVGSIARNSMTSVFTNGINLARKSDTLRGYLVNGQVGASSNDYLVPTYYPADAGDWFSGSTYQTLGTDDFRGQIAFYDQSLNFISQSEILKRENGVIRVQAPSGTAYVRVSYPIPFYGYTKIERGKVGTTYSVPPEDGASVDSVNNLSSSISQTYATKSDLQSTSANVQTLINSSSSSGAGNLIGNSDFSGNDPLYLWRYSGTGNYDGLNVWTGSDDWRLQSTDSRTVYMHSASLGAGMFDEMATDFLVESGKIYQVSAYTGAHRSRVVIFVYYWDKDNKVLGTSFDKTLNNMNNLEALGGRNLSGYKRIFQNVTAPDGCVKMSLVIRRDNADIGDPYAFVVRAQAVEVKSLSAPVATWQKGSLTTNFSKLVDSSVMTNYSTKSDTATTVASAIQKLDSKYQTGGATNRFYNSDFIFGLNGWNSNGSTNTLTIDQGTAKQTFGASRVVQVTSNGAWSQGLWQSVDNLAAGNKVTISVWMYGFTDNSVGLTFGIADENITPDSGYSQYQQILPGWNRYWITGTWRNNGNAVLYVHFTAAGQKVMMARPQLETGSMLTDWKQSNGDVDDQFTNQAAAIANTYTKADTNTAISGAINSYNASLSVGGRNYFKKSTSVVNLGNSSGIARTDTGFVATGRYENDSQVRVLDLIPEPGTYTVSFEHNMDVGSFPITIELSDQSSFTFQARSGVWQKVQGTLTSTQSNPQNWIDVINLTGQQHRFRYFKIEKGTKATDWTPAPEDISSALDANAKATSDVQANVNYVDGKVNSVSSRVDTISSTVGNNTAAIQQQQSVTNGLAARASIKLDVNGYVAGTQISNDGQTADFAIRSDTFSIVPPSNVGNNKTQMFYFMANPKTLPNGTVIPAGLKLTDALIGELSASKINVESLSALTANFGTFTTTAADGSKTIQTGGKKEVYDANGVLRYRSGVW